jgi:hypothetical protein
MKKQKLKLSIGLILISVNFFVNQFSCTSAVADFAKGFCSGLGVVLILSAAYKMKRVV